MTADGFVTTDPCKDWRLVGNPPTKKKVQYKSQTDVFESENQTECHVGIMKMYLSCIILVKFWYVHGFNCIVRADLLVPIISKLLPLWGAKHFFGGGGRGSLGAISHLWISRNLLRRLEFTPKYNGLNSEKQSRCKQRKKNLLPWFHLFTEICALGATFRYLRPNGKNFCQKLIPLSKKMFCSTANGWLRDLSSDKRTFAIAAEFCFVCAKIGGCDVAQKALCVNRSRQSIFRKCSWVSAWRNNIHANEQTAS